MSLNENLGPIVSNNSYIKSVLFPYNNQLNVGHLNCRSIKAPSKIDEIKSIVRDNTFDIFALSETWLASDISNRTVEIPGYTLCRSDRQAPGRGGGIGIFLSKGMIFKHVCKTSIPSCELILLEITIGNEKLLFGVVYLPTGDLHEFECLHSDLFSEYSNILIVGDFNCNLFNHNKTTLIRTLCTRANLSTVHNSKPTHFDLARRSTSLIDFMLVSNISLISYSDQVQCPSVSDHALIFASLSLPYTCPLDSIQYRDYNNIGMVYALF